MARWLLGSGATLSWASLACSAGSSHATGAAGAMLTGLLGTLLVQATTQPVGGGALFLTSGTIAGMVFTLDYLRRLSRERDAMDLMLAFCRTAADPTLASVIARMQQQIVRPGGRSGKSSTFDDVGRLPEGVPWSVGSAIASRTSRRPGRTRARYSAATSSVRSRKTSSKRRSAFWIACSSSGVWDVTRFPDEALERLQLADPEREELKGLRLIVAPVHSHEYLVAGVRDGESYPGWSGVRHVSGSRVLPSFLHERQAGTSLMAPHRRRARFGG